MVPAWHGPAQIHRFQGLQNNIARIVMRRIDSGRGNPPPMRSIMSRGMALVFVLVQFVTVALCGLSAAADGIGIVLLHGKQGMPEFTELEFVPKVSPRQAFCWNVRRCAGRAAAFTIALYSTCLEDIDAAVERLKNRARP